MKETDSTISETQTFSYLKLLQQIDKLQSFSTKLNDFVNVTEETWNVDELEIIFNDITENIDHLLSQMVLEKRVMFILSVMNTYVRIAAIDKSNLIISRKSFHSMFNKINEMMWYICRGVYSPASATDMVNSMLLNLVKDNFIDVCLNRLSTNGIRSNIDSVTTTTTDDESSKEEKIDFNRILECYFYYAETFTDRAVFRSGNEFKRNYSSLLISLQAFISNFLTDTDKYVSKVPLQLVMKMLYLVWNLTDKIPLIPIFIDAGYAEKTIEWINTDVFASHIEDLGEPIFSIVYNLSRDKTGLKHLRTKRAFDMHMKHKQLVDEQNSRSLTTIFGTTLVALAINDEQPEENRKIIIETSEILYRWCQEADQDADLKAEGMHLSELLELLHRAFSNTYAIKHILDNNMNENLSPIQYFAQLLLSIYGALLDPEPDQLEQHAVEYLLKILLQISSYPEYLKELTDNAQFCIVIECLAKRPKQNDAKRIWYNLEQIISPDKQKETNSSMVYISYDLADKDFCKEFIKELRRKISLPIWVDYENVELGESMWEHSYPIIQSATVIIALVSTAYGENIDKFEELSYIVSMTKAKEDTLSLIIVKAEPNFHCDRSGLKSLLHDKLIIPNNNKDNIGKITSEVYERIAVPKRRLCKCLPFQVKSRRKKIVKSPSIPDMALPLREIGAPKQSVNPTSDTSGLTFTKRRESHTIVTNLSEQTGSADTSTWV